MNCQIHSRNRRRLPKKRWRSNLGEELVRYGLRETEVVDIERWETIMKETLG